jgi:hypothetical protein
MRIATLILLGACGGSHAAADHFAATPAATGSDALVQIAVRTSPEQPPVRGIVDCDVLLTRPDGTPLTGVTVAVEPWMPAHGHGASTTPTLRETGGGHYLVSDADLFMPGDWQLRFTLSGPIADDINVNVTVE